jgi:LysM repeat protein
LGNVEASGTQTAQAVNPSLLNTFTPGSAPQNPTATLTPFIQLPTTSVSTSTATLAVPGGSTTTPQPQVPPGSNPQTYPLQRDEFPFCIARRYGVDPTALLKASNLTSPDIYYAGLVLNIPSGPAWSVADLGPRSLRNHPATYVVTGNADTSVFGVACKFGDVFPDAIVSANPGITLNSTLTVGQSLIINP